MKSISLRSGKTMVSTMTSVFFRPSETKSLRSFFFSPLPFPSISLYFEWCIRTGQWRTKVCLILCNRPRKPQFWHFLGFIFSFFFFFFFFFLFVSFFLLFNGLSFNTSSSSLGSSLELDHCGPVWCVRADHPERARFHEDPRGPRQEGKALQLVPGRHLHCKRSLLFSFPPFCVCHPFSLNGSRWSFIQVDLTFGREFTQAVEQKQVGKHWSHLSPLLVCFGFGVGKNIAH